MSTMIPNPDFNAEVVARRSREAGDWARDKALRRHARGTSATGSRPGLRVRFVELTARTLGVAGEVVSTSRQPQPPTPAEKPHG